MAISTVQLCIRCVLTLVALEVLARAPVTNRLVFIGLSITGSHLGDMFQSEELWRWLYYDRLLLTERNSHGRRKGKKVVRKMAHM